MKSRLLFITRKRNGIGGMQQYTQDLLRAFGYLYGNGVRVVWPGGFTQTCLFPLRAIIACMRAAISGIPIHLGDGALAPLVLIAKKWNPKTQVSITACGLDIVYPAWWYQKLLRRSLPRIDRVVCISHATADEVRKRGAKPERIHIVPCGVWEDRFATMDTQKKDKTLQLLSIARLVPRKGIFWFVDAVLPKLVEQFENVHYTIIGEGSEKAAIQNIIHQKNLHAHCTLRGHASPSERNVCFHSADIFVMPNVPIPGDMEGFGIACIEATSRGVPVAAARIEGVQDAVIDGETGRFFRPKDTDDAVQVITQLVHSPLQHAAVMHASQKHFHWRTISTQYAHALAV